MHAVVVVDDASFISRLPIRHIDSGEYLDFTIYHGSTCVKYPYGEMKRAVFDIYLDEPLVELAVIGFCISHEIILGDCKELFTCQYFPSIEPHGISSHHADADQNIQQDSLLEVKVSDSNYLYLVVNASSLTVLKAGKGVFAKVNISKGSIICEYRGAVKALSVIGNRRTSDKMMLVRRIDAALYVILVCAYINDCTSFSNPS